MRAPGGGSESLWGAPEKTVGPSRVHFRELKNSELWTQYEKFAYMTLHGAKTEM